MARLLPEGLQCLSLQSLTPTARSVCLDRSDFTGVCEELLVQFFSERRCSVSSVELGRVCVVFAEGCAKMERGANLRRCL